MTDEAMSPLRRRMIEDMSMRRLAPKTQKDYIQVIKNLAVFYRAIARRRKLRGHTTFSAAGGCERRRRGSHQPQRIGAAVLFQGDAQTIRHRRAYAPDP
jgi:hypothetical protein